MRKVLVITFYWPPAGGGGVQRVAKFCKYLSSYNWKPYVVTIKDVISPHFDNSLTKDIKNIDVRYARSIGPNLRKKRKSILPASEHLLDTSKNKIKIFMNKAKNLARNNIFIPDTKIFWYKAALKKAEDLIKEKKIDLLFTSSPPYTVQLVGLKIKKKFNIPWVVDFRDPWVENVYYNNTYRNTLTKYINKKMENRVLNSADIIVTVGPKLKKILRHKTNKTIKIIPNGYDLDDFRSHSYKPDKFIVGYYGSLNKDQIPRNLLKIINEFRYSNETLYSSIVLRLAGNIDLNALKIIESILDRDKIDFQGYINHDDLVTKLMQEQMLLQLIHEQKNNEVIIGGKLYEYIYTGNPILCIGNKESDAASLVKESATGKIFSYTERDELKRFIIECYNNWKNHKLNTGEKRFEKYERKNLTKSLVNIFDSMIMPNEH